MIYSIISVYPPSSMATARIADRSGKGTLFFSICEATITASRLPQVSRRVMLRSRFSRITANMSCDSFPEQLLRQVIAALFRPVPDLTLPINEPGAAGKHLIQPDAVFGELGYTEPTEFCLRRYYTSNVPKGPHTSVRAHTVTSNPFVAQYNWGFWDLLAWNNIHTIDGVQSLIFNEEATLDSVTAYTNQTMHPSRYNAPRYSHSFYEPEQLFAAYEQGIEINKSLDGFKYDYERMIYVKELTMTLEPVTYIYLTQVILHNNRGRISSIDGSANLSGLSRSVTLNTGYTGSDPITVHFGARMKRDCRKQDELVDIIGGRLVTFGICNSNGFRTLSRQAVVDNSHHYLDVSMQFNNGNDSTLVFDVTEQVRQRFKGGVITVELDVDTIPIPSRRGGSGFDAVVKDFEEVTHEIEM